MGTVPSREWRVGIRKPNAKLRRGLTTCSPDLAGGLVASCELG